MCQWLWYKHNLFIEKDYICVYTSYITAVKWTESTIDTLYSPFLDPNQIHVSLPFSNAGGMTIKNLCRKSIGSQSTSKRSFQFQSLSTKSATTQFCRLLGILTCILSIHSPGAIHFSRHAPTVQCPLPIDRVIYSFNLGHNLKLYSSKG